MKKKIIAGLVGAAALLAMTAAGARAEIPYQTCDSGWINSITAGFVSSESWPHCLGKINVTCLDGELAGKTGDYCIHRDVYPNGILAVALTAVVMGTCVDYKIFPAHLDPPLPSYLNGIIISIGIPSPCHEGGTADSE